MHTLTSNHPQPALSHDSNSRAHRSAVLAMMSSLTDDLSSDLGDAVASTRRSSGQQLAPYDFSLVMGLAAALRTLTTTCCKETMAEDCDVQSVAVGLDDSFELLSLRGEDKLRVLLCRALERARVCARETHDRVSGGSIGRGDYMRAAPERLPDNPTRTFAPRSLDVLPPVDAAKYHALVALTLSLLFNMEDVIRDDIKMDGTLGDEAVDTLLGCSVAGSQMIYECHRQPLQDALGLHSSGQAMRVHLQAPQLEESGPRAQDIVATALNAALYAAQQALLGRAV